MKVAHHGSADPGLPALLERLQPRMAAIEVGGRTPTAIRRHRHSKRCKAAVPTVLRTDRDGTTRLHAATGGCRSKADEVREADTAESPRQPAADHRSVTRPPVLPIGFAAVTSDSSCGKDSKNREIASYCGRCRRWLSPAPSPRPAAHADASTTVVLSQVAFPRTQRRQRRDDPDPQRLGASAQGHRRLEDRRHQRRRNEFHAGDRPRRHLAPREQVVPVRQRRRGRLRRHPRARRRAAARPASRTPAALQLRTAADVVVDAVGHTGLTATAPLGSSEGDGLPFPGARRRQATQRHSSARASRTRTAIRSTSRGRRSARPRTAPRPARSPTPARPALKAITDITTIQKTDDAVRGPHREGPRHRHGHR